MHSLARFALPAARAEEQAVMPTVELIFDATCPHVGAAREQLREALTHAGRPAIWTEWERSAPDVPAHVRRSGSPTVLIAGRDVADGADLDAGAGCRIYRDPSGARIAAPSSQVILAALLACRGGRE